LFGHLVNGGVVEIGTDKDEFTFNFIDILSPEKTKVEEDEDSAV